MQKVVIQCDVCQKEKPDRSSLWFVGYRLISGEHGMGIVIQPWDDWDRVLAGPMTRHDLCSLEHAAQWFNKELCDMFNSMKGK